MSGIGVGFAAGSWLAAPSVHTFEGALLLGPLFWAGVAFVVVGLLYYLLARYLNGRANQRT